ncbi:MAG: YfhO family protein [Candidatus Hydrogenedentales bacterium]
MMRRVGEDVALVVFITVVALAAAWSLAPPDVDDSLGAEALSEGTRNESIAPVLREYRFLWESVQRGESPLWRPDDELGFPFFAAWHTRCLSPFTLPFYALSWDMAVWLSLLLKFAAAGLIAYYAGRRLGFLPPFALCVAILVQLAPIFTNWVWHPAVDAAVWAPVLILFAERLALGQYRFWPVGALFAALALSSGAVFAVSWLAALLILYIVLRSVRLRPARAMAEALAVFMLVCAVGLGLLAVQLLPWAELTQHATWQSTSFAPVSPQDVFAIVAPISEARTGVFSQDLLYLGSVALLLVALWPAVRHAALPPHRRRIDCLLVLTILVPIPAFIPATTAIASPVAWIAAMPFLAGMVGAAAAEAWLLLTPEQCAATIRRYMMLLIALVVTAGAAYWAAGATAPTAVASVTPALFINAAAALCLLVVLGLTLLRPSFPVMGYSLAALILITRLAGTTTSGPVVWAEAEGELSGRSDASAFTVPERMPGDWTLARTAAYQQRAQNDASLLRSEGREMLELSAEEINGLYAPLRSQLQLLEVMPQGGAVFRDSRALPQAAVVYEGRQRATFAAQELAGDAPPLMESTTPIPMGPPDNDAEAAEIYSSNTHHEYNAATASPAVLVLAEAWYPGWTASVNAAPAPVFPVNVAFRGVALPAGEHHVVLAFEPDSVALGLQISAGAAAFVLLGLLLLPILRARRRRRGF